MSFGVGIGDVIAITDFIVKTYKLYKDTPKEVLQIGKDAQGTGIRLAFLGKLVEQPGSLAYAGKDGMHVDPKKLLAHTMEDLKRDLTSVSDLVQKWNAICENGSIAEKLWFTTVDVGKLKDLDVKLRQHDGLIDSILQKLQSAADDTVIAQNAKLQQQIENMATAMATTMAKIEQQTRERRKWEDVVHRHGPDAVSQAARCPDERPWRAIKNDLMKQGLSEDAADRFLEPIKAGLQGRPQLDATTEPDPNAPQQPKTPQIVALAPPPAEGKNEDLQPTLPALPLSPSPKPIPPAAGGPRLDSVTIRATAKKKTQVIEASRSRILFVDATNSRRSIVAQAYLELARVWTINTTNRWLFKEVGSAGTDVETPFTLRHKDKLRHGTADGKPKPAAAAATAGPQDDHLQALIDQNTFRSNERSMIVKRLRERKPQGLHPEHFYKWDYFICFGNDTHTALQTLRLCAIAEHKDLDPPPKAKIVLLRGAPWHVQGQELVNAVKATIKTWLRDELRWVEPPPTADLRWSLRRTYQITTTEEHFTTMMGEGWSPGPWAVGKECTVLFDRTPRAWDRMRLISCSGTKEELDKAWGILKDKGIVEIARD